MSAHVMKKKGDETTRAVEEGGELGLSTSPYEVRILSINTTLWFSHPFTTNLMATILRAWLHADRYGSDSI